MKFITGNLQHFLNSVVGIYGGFQQCSSDCCWSFVWLWRKYWFCKKNRNIKKYYLNTTHISRKLLYVLYVSHVYLFAYLLSLVMILKMLFSTFLEIAFVIWICCRKLTTANTKNLCQRYFLQILNAVNVENIFWFFNLYFKL